jgi:prepilin-type N-terminal cleavage/methylation domain-containing protein
MIKFTKRSRRAFSLVEILFAVIIIGVLTAVAVPSLFNNKGKADDSNAKQTLRAAYTLISTSLDDSGSLQGMSSSTDTTGFIAFLGTVDKNLSFVSTTATNKNAAGNTTNVRTMGIDVSTDIVKIVALGGKTGAGYNCFGIQYDITGATATKFMRYTDQPIAGCATTLFASASTTQLTTGDFPLK